MWHTRFSPISRSNQEVIPLVCTDHPWPLRLLAGANPLSRRQGPRQPSPAHFTRREAEHTRSAQPQVAQGACTEPSAHTRPPWGRARALVPTAARSDARRVWRRHACAPRVAPPWRAQRGDGCLLAHAPARAQARHHPAVRAARAAAARAAASERSAAAGASISECCREAVGEPGRK